MIKRASTFCLPTLLILATLLLLVACSIDPSPTPQYIPTIQNQATPTSTPTPPTPTPTPEYDRDDWGGWRDSDRDCLNTRAEVLIEESLAEPVLDDCKVVSGRWIDPWSGIQFEDAGSMEIDHHVPLANAHISGSSAWTDEQRREFYNDSENLNALSQEINRSKGARSPADWQPPDETSHCDYARQWDAIKTKYQLSTTTAERQALDEMLTTCTLIPVVPTPRSTLPVPTPILTSTPVVPTSEQRVYATCEDAEAAGEQRIKGSKGNGLGFPTTMIRDAPRDGDNDGVVCEQ